MREVLVFTTQLPLSELWSKVLGSKLVDFSYQKHIFCLFLKSKDPVSSLISNFSWLELVMDSLDVCVFSLTRFDTVETRAAWRFFSEQSQPLDPNHLSTDTHSGSQRWVPLGLSGSLRTAGDLSCLFDIRAPCSVLYPYLWVSKHCEHHLWWTEGWTLDRFMSASFSL